MELKWKLPPCWLAFKVLGSAVLAVGVWVWGHHWELYELEHQHAGLVLTCATVS